MRSNQPDDLLKRIARLERDLSELRTRAPIGYSTVSMGALRVATDAGETVFEIGQATVNGVAVWGLVGYRPSGSVAFRATVGEDGSVNWQLVDAAGNVVVSVDESEGQGLGTPWLPLRVLPTSELTAPSTSTSSGSYVPLHRISGIKQQARVRMRVYTKSDSGTAGEIRVRAVADGSVVVAAVAIPAADPGTYRYLEGEVVGTHLSDVDLNVEARRTSGAGSVHACVVYAVGLSSTTHPSVLTSTGEIVSGPTLVTADYAATSSDTVILADAGGLNPLTVTLPDASAVAGRQYTVVKTDSSANLVVVATSGGQAINTASRRALLNHGDHLTAISTGYGWVLLNRERDDAVNARDYGLVSDGSDDILGLQAAVDATPAGRTLLLPAGDYSISAALNINKPMTIVAYGATITQTSGAVTGLNITSSDVNVHGLRLVGPDGSALSSGSKAISVAGTNTSARISRITLTDCVLEDWGQYGVYAIYANVVRVRRCFIDTVWYAGVMLLSVHDGIVDDNDISNILAPSPAYGVAAARLEADTDLTDDPRCSDIQITNNRISNVASWEGIDTHSGQRIMIAGNTVYGCAIGILVGPSREETLASYAYAPLDCTVKGNIIDSGVTDGSGLYGISFTGASGSGERATGTVVGNVIRGCGNEASNTTGGIYCHNTDGLAVTGNWIDRPSPIGIVWYFNNRGFTCTGNTVIDPWADGGSVISPAIATRGNDNTGTIGDNTLTRGDLSGKTYIAAQGIRLDGTGNSIALGINHSTCTAYLSDASNAAFAVADHHTRWKTDNTWDLGASGAARPRDLHLGRDAVIGGTLSVGGEPVNIDVQVFTSTGTWTKPSWATANSMTTLIVQTGGSGGGSGRRGAAGTVRCGGGGGAGGSLSITTIPTSALGATENAVVSAGGAGGAAVTTDNTDGNPGSAGGTTQFGTLVRAPGGGAGAGGTAASGAGGAATTGSQGATGGGGAASASGGAGGAGGVGIVASGGGAGGGITSGDVASNGGVGNSVVVGNVAQAAGGVAGGAGPGAGYNQPVNSGIPGNGGGGGAGSTTGAGQTGGAGGRYGGGGGGGGASVNGNNSGAGGAGGPGIIIAVTRGL